VGPSGRNARVSINTAGPSGRNVSVYVNTAGPSGMHARVSPITAGQSRSGRSEITDANEEDFNEDENIDIYDDPSFTHQGIVLYLTT
jgi:hypothetical protein